MLTLFHFGTDKVTDAVVLPPLLPDTGMVNSKIVPMWNSTVTNILAG